ncbi:MAG: hypothetical protein MUF54_14015, partial [Polyangiaceae bacterium]|nr:hypothetical protein [Polyangiaceae bacterium]
TPHAYCQRQVYALAASKTRRFASLRDLPHRSQKRPVSPATVILGDVSVQGNIKSLPTIGGALQIAVDNGALRGMVPIANKSQVAGLPEEVAEKLDIVFYGDVDRAVVKALGG